jgi:hypothetical protein
MRETATSLRDFVRGEQQQHRNFAVPELEKNFFLPPDDLDFWLSDNAFATFRR